MKTIELKATKEIQRVSNEKAESLVRKGAARYVDKATWKAIQKPRPASPTCGQGEVNED